MQLKYHHKAFDLLQREPAISDYALQLLAQVEQQRNIGLPSSVLEWYSLDGAVETLSLYGNSDRPVPLEHLGKTEQDWYGVGSRDFVSEGFLLVLTENQGVCHWAVELDGSEDPPVVVEVDSAPNVVWQPYADTFLTFVYTRIWDWQPFAYSALSAQDQPLDQGDLAVLRQQYREAPTTYNWPGKRNYRLHRRDQRVLIWPGEDQADWFLAAKTPESLIELAQAVWNVGGLSKTLYGVNTVGEEILRRLRGNQGSS